MYPYNRNTSIYKEPSNAPTLKARENAKEITILGSDKRLLELLCIAMDETNDNEAFYKSLMGHDDIAEDSEIVRNIYLDEMKHKKQLQDVHHLLTGKRYTPKDKEGKYPPRRPQPSYSKNLPSALRSALMDALEDADFLRDLLLAMTVGELWDIMFEIFTDKQDHCTRLNYLCAKYRK